MSNYYKKISIDLFLEGKNVINETNEYIRISCY